MAKVKEPKEAKETKEPKNKIKITESGPCKKKISIEIPHELIKTALDEQYNDFRRDAVVPGFRKGRAPQRLLEKRYGSDISERVKLKLLADASDEAVKDNEIDILGDPDVDHENIELPGEGPMKFEFEVEVRPEFELPKLKGIKVEKPTIEFSDEQIDEEVETMRKRAGIWVPKKGSVEIDEQVVADVILKIEGLEEEERHDNIEIFARKNGFVTKVPVEKLDKLLIGANPGDTKKTTVDVPETFFNEDYRGKKIDIEITVKEIKKLEPAELNEGFFKRFGVENLEALHDAIAEAREQQSEQQGRAAMSDQIHKYLLDNTKFDLPADVVAEQSTRVLQRQYTNMLMRGLKREQIDEQMEELRASSAEQAQEQLKLFFIMDKIADKLDISVSEEELNGHIAQAALSRGRRPEKMREELARDGSLAQFSLQVREQKCVEKLLEDAEIAEVKAGKAKKATKKAAKTATAKTGKKTVSKKATAKKAAKARKSDKESAAKTKTKTTRKEATAKRSKKKGQK